MNDITMVTTRSIPTDDTTATMAHRDTTTTLVQDPESIDRHALCANPRNHIGQATLRGSTVIMTRSVTYAVKKGAGRYAIPARSARSHTNASRRTSNHMHTSMTITTCSLGSLKGIEDDQKLSHNVIQSLPIINCVIMTPHPI